MKSLFIIAVAFLLMHADPQVIVAKTDKVITVFGNCGSCKKAIEKAAKSVEGVESATWDKKKKTLSVQFDEAKTSLDLIEKAIIAIGYDTEHMRAEDAVYDTLHSCCKYDRKPQ
ncbi:MAG: heavy-metal-associated domain-containing protein [Bacteroidota bacterium]